MVKQQQFQQLLDQKTQEINMLDSQKNQLNKQILDLQAQNLLNQQAQPQAQPPVQEQFENIQVEITQPKMTDEEANKILNQISGDINQIGINFTPSGWNKMSQQYQYLIDKLNNFWSELSPKFKKDAFGVVMKNNKRVQEAFESLKPNEQEQALNQNLKDLMISETFQKSPQARIDYLKALIFGGIKMKGWNLD